jgi:hypothetical protein
LPRATLGSANKIARQKDRLAGELRPNRSGRGLTHIIARSHDLAVQHVSSLVDEIGNETSMLWLQAADRALTVVPENLSIDACSGW